MNAEEIIAFADAMRAYAQEDGRDLNAASLFAHEVLVRALKAERLAHKHYEMLDVA